MSISNKLSLSLLSLTLIASNSFGMGNGKLQIETRLGEKNLETTIKNLEKSLKEKDTKITILLENQNKTNNLLDDYKQEYRNLLVQYGKEVDSYEQKAKAAANTNKIISYFKNHMNRSALYHLGLQAAVEAFAWNMRRELEQSSFTDEETAIAEKFINYVVKASRSYTAATAITGAMNMAKTNKYGQKILNKDKAYNANAYTAFIGCVAAQFLVDRYGNEGVASQAAVYAAGIVGSVVGGVALPKISYIN